MLRIAKIKGKTIREWATMDLPHGHFERMARKVHPFWGIYAEAGAKRQRYRVTRYTGHDDGEIEVEAFNKLHAQAIAWDEEGWKLGETRATLIEDRA